MKLKQLTLKQSLNKAYRLIKPERADIERFKTNFKTLLGHINPAETEENMKGHVTDFLKNTWYSPTYHIATKGRTDFVIHTGKDATHPAGVLFETKKPSSKEMVTISDLNRKAMHEIILYYLRERIDHHNNDIKYLVITNVYEWFVFDAPEFEKLFFKNSALMKEYKAWTDKQKVSANNDLFYNEIAKPFLAGLTEEIQFTYFNVAEYKKLIQNDNKNNDNKLIPLFKILSPTNLLKLPFANDSNTLDKGFYNELLYIIGLEEVKEGGKKLIRRRQEGKRIDGSLLENTIVQLETENCLHKVSDRQSYGETESEQLFSIALELCITWVNRVLFLKLLEAQLMKYHNCNENYRFLNYKFLPQYDELYKLFFHVLARKHQERMEKIKFKYRHVPYLNSSLFDITALEDQTIRINMLDDTAEMPLLQNTILKDGKNRPVASTLNTLQYLFDFLNAYDFASESSEEIQEERKTLINASVLGLIFEKINGYKDGSIFTPGFITMYMCRQAIRQVVLNKFKTTYNWIAATFDDLHNYISDDRTAKKVKEYNTLINSLTICDPAVGSGHFLVSALNELIAIKSELGILADVTGKRLTGHIASVENDELIVTDTDRNFFTYYVQDLGEKILIPNSEVQRVQEALFHEKETLIENCLFGVDINAKSVQICRLRLWIELLKNAYYIAEGNASNGELQTLPNIDINIKTGNSLISRFGLQEDLKPALANSKFNIHAYKVAVQSYRQAENKGMKKEMETLISSIKKDFTSELTFRNRIAKDYVKGKALVVKLSSEINSLQQWKEQIPKKLITQLQKASTNLEKLERKVQDAQNNIIYRNSFEWRFEFPEVLDTDGNFLGFDIIIGNPPYIPLEAFDESTREFFRRTYKYFERKFETSVLFIVLGMDLLNKNGKLAYIAPVTWQTGDNYAKLRRHLIEAKDISTIINLPFNTFEDAYVEAALYFLGNGNSQCYDIYNFAKKSVHDLNSLQFTTVAKSLLQGPNYKLILDLKTNSILSKYSSEEFVTLGSITKSTQGLSGSNFKETTNLNHFVFPFLSKGNVYNYALKKDVLFYTDMEEKQSLMQFYNAEPKVLIRRIINRQDRLSVAYCDEKLVFKKDINPFIPLDQKEWPAKFLLGILASKFISYLYVKSSSIATKDDFRQTTLTELRALPIPIVSNDKKTQMVALVEKVLQNEGLNPVETINEIDQLVYILYKLSPEEIEFVKQATIQPVVIA